MLWQCGAKSQEDYGATNNEPKMKNKDYQHSNPLQQSTSHNGYRK